MKMTEFVTYGIGLTVLALPALGDDGDQAAWNFDQDQAGKMPTGWSVRQTNPSKASATWQVMVDPHAPGKNKILALTRTRNHGSTFNLAVAEHTSFKDLDLTVKVRAVDGEEDQGGGPIWRCTDENNYYICRFNPLEGNYRLYVVEEGRRTQLKSSKVKTRPNQWYTVRVTMTADRITCYLDGKKMLETENDTFSALGMVGLWTKADAVTSFDDFQVRQLHTKVKSRPVPARGRASDP
ncbi:MAG: DUF1080 domain-containing protein [Planctomycetes bacterium]|nr:DUF1080 domain-containing protein [Planctomycetota bacterium]